MQTCIMSEEWIVKAASNVVENHGLVILENPGLRKKLDEILLSLWPQVKSHLSQTGLIYGPEEHPIIETVLSTVLVRSLTFMLFDIQNPICRTKIDCTYDHWMLNHEFFLNLPEETDFTIVQEILGNSRFSGNPPTMMIIKSDPVNHFQITFDSGNGEGWGMHDESYMLDNIRRSIDVHVRMYEIALDGIPDTVTAEEFLSTAYEVYETK